MKMRRASMEGSYSFMQKFRGSQSSCTTSRQTLDASFAPRHGTDIRVTATSSQQDWRKTEFILSLLSRFEEMPFLWLGLTDAQVEGVWAWQDGTLLQNHRFIKVQWDSEHRDCADLRGDGSVFASDCMSYSPWLCKKPMVPPEF